MHKIIVTMIIRVTINNMPGGVKIVNVALEGKVWTTRIFFLQQYIINR